MKLGQWLKTYRDSHSLSQGELAERMGIEQSYLSKLENDKSMPSAEMLDDILQATETTLEDLLSALDQGYLYNQLSALPQVKTYLVNEKLQVQQKTNNRLFLFGLLLCLGSFIFYLGMAEVLSSNTQYQYTSPGLLKPDESLRAYNMSVTGQMSNEEFRRRYNPKSILIDEYKVRSFVSETNGERRFYTLDKELHVESSFNRILKALGVLLFSGGFFGVVLLIINRKVLKNQ